MYTFERFNFRPFPWFLLLLGIILTVYGMYLEAAIFGTPGAIFALMWKGINISASERKIRYYDRLLWFYFGKWKHLPRPQYVTVVRVNLSSARTMAIPLVAPQEGKAAVSFRINLVVDSHQRYIRIARGSRDKMLDEAMKLATLLDIRLLDHTTSDKVWLR